MLVGIFVGFGGYFASQSDHDSHSKFYLPDSAGVILGCMAISVVLTLGYVFLLKLFPREMVYILIAVSLLGLTGLVILGVVIGSLALVISAGVTLLIYSCVLFCLKERIKLGIALIKLTGEFITEKPQVFTVPIPVLGLALLIFIPWIYFLGSIL